MLWAKRYGTGMSELSFATGSRDGPGSSSSRLLLSSMRRNLCARDLDDTGRHGATTARLSLALRVGL